MSQETLSSIRSFARLQPQHSFITVLLALVLCLLYVIAGRKLRRSNLPIVNDYPGDLWGRKARHAYETNAKALVAEGLAKVRDHKYCEIELAAYSSSV